MLLNIPAAHAQVSRLVGTVIDETGAALPGVDVQVRDAAGVVRSTTTDRGGHYDVRDVASGGAVVSVSMPNFATSRRELAVSGSTPTTLDVTLHFVLSADVTVTGRRSFVNLADADDPAENLVGIASSASQGAVTAKQLEARPLSRAGEVLETVPGVIVSQHSGEGKANQYYLRGFNLDHGTDFATTVAGVPANMPTHAHGHGYTDLNFVIPELVSGVQYSKGPYFAEQGDFATAGTASIAYATSLERPTLQLTGGTLGFARLFGAASTQLRGGAVLAGGEVVRNNGPWTRADELRKYNGVVRYSRGNAATGFVLTGMAYRARWNATDQIPRRAVSAGTLGRFDSLDTSDGGETSRYSGALEWQHSSAQTLTKAVVYGVGYQLDLLSNFTYFLDDPVRGDQFRQVDRRTFGGARLTHRRLVAWGARPTQLTGGIQIRADDIALRLEHTQRGARLDTVRHDEVTQASLGAFVEHAVEWSPRTRSTLGVRAEGYRFAVDARSLPANSGTATSGVVSPKAGLVVGPFSGTEFYANAGTGFHSNDARGTTMRVDPSTGGPADRVTPLARATGAEFGVRTIAVPHLQSTLSLWTLGLASELVFIGDAGTTTAGRPSRRSGIEFANYYHPWPWLTLDADLAWSRARFTDADPAGANIPGSVRTVASGGATLDTPHGVTGAVRLRYFGTRPLVEDGSQASSPTTLVNAELGYRWSGRHRLSVDVLNVLDARNSDIDYFYTSRLPGEPAGGVDDIHFHPVLPRTIRIGLTLGLGR